MAASEYELERDARIQRNKQRLMELNLPEVWAAWLSDQKGNMARLDFAASFQSACNLASLLDRSIR